METTKAVQSPPGSNVSSEQRIKDAARKVFLMKGFAGARVQEIANEAGMNRVLVNYYFRGKERLFQVVFQDAMSDIDKRLSVIVQSDIPIREKIMQIEMFIMNEFNQHPDLMREVFQESRATEAIMGLVSELDRAHNRGEIRYTGYQVLVTIMSFCMFPFAGQAMFSNILEIDSATYMRLMQERKIISAEMVWRAIAV
jgi:TetR/AcrR family transcriptional regulator